MTRVSSGRGAKPRPEVWPAPVLCRCNNRRPVLARLIQERDLTPEGLGLAIGELTADRARLLKMADAARSSRIIDAAATLAELCIAAGAER